MRRSVVALVVVLLALVLAGCGGGGGAETATPPAGEAAAPAPAGGTPGSSSLAPLTNRSANVTDTFVPFSKIDSASIPAELRQKIIVEKQPTLIYFYDSSQQISNEVRTIIDKVRSQNRGLVDLVAYDIGKYLSADSTGVVSIDSSKFKKAGDDTLAVKLARDPAINVTFTPYIVITDGQGYMIYKHHGLVDREFLEREVLRAAR
jgi:hypothetical protein